MSSCFSYPQQFCEKCNTGTDHSQGRCMPCNYEYEYCNECGKLRPHSQYKCMPCRAAKFRKRRHDERDAQPKPPPPVPTTSRYCDKCKKIQPTVSKNRCRDCHSAAERKRRLDAKPPPPPTDSEKLQIMLSKMVEMCVYCKVKPRKYGINDKTGKPFKSCSRECAAAAKAK
jgi:hypothetical protein